MGKQISYILEPAAFTSLKQRTGHTSSGYVERSAGILIVKVAWRTNLPNLSGNLIASARLPRFY